MFNYKATLKGQMLNSLNKIEKHTTRHDVVKVSPDLHSYYNSVNILTGAQGEGKTFTAMTEIIGISQVPNTHLIIYIKKKDFDPSVEAVKHLCGCPLISIDYDKATDYIKNLLKYKKLYNEFVRLAVEAKINYLQIPAHVENVEDLYNNLFIKDFSNEWLNTLILFDDVGNSQLFKNKDSYFNNLMKTCRDINCIFYLTIHGITQLSPQIKENCAVIYITKGLSRDGLAIIHR
jgi:hypothetical protein